MAAFLHVAPGGMRFNGPELGAWYAAGDIRTAAAEVGHHLRREAVARSVATMNRTYRTYSASYEQVLWGRMAAAAIVTVMPQRILYILPQNYTIRDLTGGVMQ